MSDRYLFRGKRTDNGEWAYGYLIMCKYTRNDNGNLYYVTKPKIVPVGNIGEAEYDGDGNYYEYEVIPETVGQCTGLQDKNGKRIFDGDITGHRSNYSGNMVIAVVKYEDGCFLAMTDRNSGFNLSDKIEVIGNIHDNIEVLEEER